MAILAIDDEGHEYQIEEYGSVIDVPSVDNTSQQIDSQQIDGVPELFLSTGEAVSDKGDGVYEVVSTGKILRRQ